MKKQLAFLFAALLSMVSIKSLAHDIAVANSDGKTIYYIYTNNNTELAVSCRGDTPGRYSNEYSGNIVIPESVLYNGMTYSVTSIGENAFGGCTAIISISIPISVKSIGIHAFWGCTGLTSVTIPNGVTSIGEKAFDDCSSLASVIIPHSVTNIGNQAFNNCSSLTSITIPSSVTSIGEYAFSGCSDLASVTIPNSVTSIGDRAFFGTAWYNNQPNGLIYAGKVVYTYKGDMPENTIITLNEGTLGIADYAFRDCSGLTSVTIPNSVTSIGQDAFSGCKDLTSITIPNSVTSIGKHAFLGCKDLVSVIIGNSVTIIGEAAFCGCSGLTSVTIPNGVKDIGSLLFCECYSLTSVTIPNSVTSIGEKAFDDCSSLASVIIPHSVTNIGNQAFNNCSSLVSVTIGNSVTSIGGYAFSGCSCLSSVHISDMVAWCNIKFSNIYSNPLRYAHHLYLNGNEVKDIAIPNSVTNISDFSFSYCSSLTSITIPSSVTSIGEYAFNECSSLESATISNKVTTISNYLFQKCTRLTSMNIPNGVTSIGNYAFDGCYSLSNLAIPQSVTTIGEYAFQDCRSLATVTIPQDMQIIKRNTFTRCSSLNSITIPAKVEYIYQEAFKGCGLEEVKVLATTPPFAYDNTFSNFDIPLSVPSNNIEKYQTTTPWSKFSSIKGNEDSCGNNESANVINGHEYIDLGLPSGKCWATTNYGSSTPDGYGSYIYWTERNTISSEWGSDWTTPSLQDILELESNCTWTWDSKNGHSGYTVTGKNGNSIFLPASGFQMYGQSSAKKVNEWAYYWTSDMSDDMAYIIMSSSSTVTYGQMEYNYTMLPIRPITISSGDNTQPQKCATPTISYTNGKLTFNCETEGAECQYAISDNDIKSGAGNEVQLEVTYTVNVYATKVGYENSEMATATLCWIDQQPQTEDITNGMANVPALAVLIQSDGGILTVQGVDDGTQVSVYGIDGIQAGSAISQNGIAHITTSLQSGSIAIVKVGEKSVKMMVK